MSECFHVTSSSAPPSLPTSRSPPIRIQNINDVILKQYSDWSRHVWYIVRQAAELGNRMTFRCGFRNFPDYLLY